LISAAVAMDIRQQDSRTSKTTLVVALPMDSGNEKFVENDGYSLISTVTLSNIENTFESPQKLLSKRPPKNLLRHCSLPRQFVVTAHPPPPPPRHFTNKIVLGINTVLFGYCSRGE